MGMIIGIVLSMLWNTTDQNSVLLLERTFHQHDKCLLLERTLHKCIDFEQEKITATERLIQIKARQDDPDLVNVIKNYYIEYPRGGKLRNIQKIKKTSQAEKVIEIYNNKVSSDKFQSIWLGF